MAQQTPHYSEVPNLILPDDCRPRILHAPEITAEPRNGTSGLGRVVFAVAGGAPLHGRGRKGLRGNQRGPVIVRIVRGARVTAGVDCDGPIIGAARPSKAAVLIFSIPKLLEGDASAYILAYLLAAATLTAFLTLALCLALLLVCTPAVSVGVFFGGAVGFTFVDFLAPVGFVALLLVFFVAALAPVSFVSTTGFFFGLFGGGGLSSSSRVTALPLRLVGGGTALSLRFVDRGGGGGGLGDTSITSLSWLSSCSWFSSLSWAPSLCS